MPLTIATASRRPASPRASRLQGSTGRTDHGPGAHPRTRHDLRRDGQLHRVQIEDWLKLKAKYVSASVWPQHHRQAATSCRCKGIGRRRGQGRKVFLAKARSGRLNIRSDCTIIRSDCTIQRSSYPCSGWAKPQNQIGLQSSGNRCPDTISLHAARRTRRHISERVRAALFVCNAALAIEWHRPRRPQSR